MEKIIWQYIYEILKHHPARGPGCVPEHRMVMVTAEASRKYPTFRNSVPACTLRSDHQSHGPTRALEEWSLEAQVPATALEGNKNPLKDRLHPYWLAEETERQQGDTTQRAMQQHQTLVVPQQEDINFPSQKKQKKRH